MQHPDREEQNNNKKYRILMVSGIYPSKERPHSGTFVKAMVDALVARGHEVEIVHPRSGPAPLRYLAATLQVFFKTLTKGFDVVHGHYGLWCLAARMQWTTPVVVTYLGDDLLGTVTINGGYSKKSRLVVRVSQWVGQHAEIMHVKTEQMKKASLRADAFVLPSGVNFDLFQPQSRDEARAKLGWKQDRYYVLFANNPAIPVKNFPLAKEAIKRLGERGMDVELVVANGLPQTAVVQYINASNALILSSIAEGSPNVVREAMACNVPVVATDVGDVASMLAKTGGCFVCSHDADALAEGLEKALQHTERTTGRADTAHLAIRELVKQMEVMYGLALERKARRSSSRVTLEKEGPYASTL